MSTPSFPFLQHLGLDDEADERAIRRAYAQRLKQIDQEADPEGFQALREAYETAMGWAHYMQQRAAAAVQEDMAATPEEPTLEAMGPAPHSPSDEASGEDTTHTRQADSDAIARAVLDALLEQLQHRPPEDLSEGRKLLEGILDDPRLLDLDAQFLFEWGMASILAQGWRPGHEFLFGPAMACFNWREDRGRLTRLGHAGRFIDVAINELEMYDRQLDTRRTPQRDLIRRLRDARRPSDRMLIQALPLVEQLVATWPNWLHMVTNTQNVLKWREWDTEVPRWRRAVTGKPHGTAAKPKAKTKPPESQNSQNVAGMLFLALALLGGLGKMLSPPSNPYTPPSYPHLANPGNSQPAPVQIPSIAPAAPYTASSPSPVMAAVPAPAVAEFSAAKKSVAGLTKGKVDAKKCADTSEILGYHGREHEKGSFGPAFDRLVLDCLLKQLWRPPIPLAAVDVSLKRHQQRTKALLDKEIATVRGNTWVSPAITWRADAPPPPSSPPPQPKPSPAPPVQRAVDDTGVWLTPGSPLSRAGSSGHQ
ncbi:MULTISPECIES: J domain-containing protein [unclassified Variovorax]|jgi:protein TonB|uniref:J domain-containing protein n=1 Tax=unclassified Variovorax TaxID=663243 RepID=UPI000F7EC9D3|nr:MULTISPECIES: J domain-containing protein [unclassified Variovorax]RSZ29976.1 J domain-containing protein [Variovorax sp. 553]RSZ30471.1 J domain-containing protein [Variovorax sp. 679]